MPLPSLNLPLPLTVGQVERALQISSDRVQRLWPHIRAALVEFGEDTIDAQLAAAANISTETRFAIIEERGSPDYFKKYEPNTSVGKILGNRDPGDGEKFKGRGPIQLTGRWNYKHYGNLMDVDLETTPEKLLDPKTSARCTVLYLRERGAFKAAKAGDWEKARKAVQPGNDPAGMARFQRALGALRSELV